MKIAYTGTIFFNQKYGGISRYFTELVKRIDANAKIVAPLSKNIYLNNINKDKKFSFSLSRLPQYNFLKEINSYLSEKVIQGFRPDIVHETYYSEKIKDYKKFKKIISVYDLIHEKYNNKFYEKKDTKKQKIIDHADHFICISEQTKKDLIDFYKISEEKVSVVYLGGDHLKNNLITKKDKIIDEPYILYTGSKRKYKNFDILIKSLSKLKNKDISLVCFGGEKLNNNELLENKSNVKIKQIYGDDKILLNLIDNSLCFINTSLYEGFSIPNIESLFSKCPLICSNIPVFREICGSAALYFDPKNSHDLANCIDEIIYNSDLRKNIIKQSIDRSKIFTWDNCAKKTLEVYNKVIVD